MADPKAKTHPLRGGELNAAVTSALVGIHNEHLGRGPKSASTFHHGNVIVTLMHEVMTPAERTLAHSGNGPAVTNMRHLFQETMQARSGFSETALPGRRMPPPDRHIWTSRLEHWRGRWSSSSARLWRLTVFTPRTLARRLERRDGIGGRLG